MTNQKILVNYAVPGALTLIEKWLKSLGVKSIHAESRQSSLKFYLKNSYVDMPFGDPDGYESDPSDVPVGKVL